MPSWSEFQQENIDPLYHHDVRVRQWAQDTNGGQPQANPNGRILMDLSGPRPPDPDPDEQARQDATPPQYRGRSRRISDPHPSTPTERQRRGLDGADFEIYIDHSPTRHQRQRAIQKAARARARAAARRTALRRRAVVTELRTIARAASSLQQSSSPLPHAPSSSLPRPSSSLPNLAALPERTIVGLSTVLMRSSLRGIPGVIEPRDLRTRLQIFNDESNRGIAEERLAREVQEAQKAQVEEESTQEEVQSVTGSVIRHLAGMELMSDAGPIVSPTTAVAGRLAGVRLRTNSPSPSPVSARLRMRHIQRDARGRFVRLDPDRTA